MQQCFALIPQVNFLTNNLNFHWRWRDRIQALLFDNFLSFFLQIFYNLNDQNPIARINNILKNKVWIQKMCFWQGQVLPDLGRILKDVLVKDVFRYWRNTRFWLLQLRGNLMTPHLKDLNLNFLRSWSKIFSQRMLLRFTHSPF